MNIVQYIQKTIDKKNIYVIMYIMLILIKTLKSHEIRKNVIL